MCVGKRGWEMSIRIQVEVRRGGAPHSSGSFARAPITIGSAADNDIVLRAPNVAACHGVVSLADAGLIFEDTSREGAFIGDVRVSGRAELGVRSVLSIPPFELDLRLRSTTPAHHHELYDTNVGEPDAFDTPDTRPIIELAETPQLAADATGENADAEPRPSLLIIDGPAHLCGQQLTIAEAPELVLGRSVEAHIRIADRAISRRHAALRRMADGSFQLVDLGSVNGVFLNGDQIKAERLEDGDEIRLGNVALAFSRR